MIDLHRKRIALQLSVVSNGGRGSNRIDYKLETWAGIRTAPRDRSLRPRLRRCLPRRHHRLVPGDDPAPVVARAVKPAECAGFDAEPVRSLEVHRAVISVAAVVAVDVAGPLLLG